MAVSLSPSQVPQGPAIPSKKTEPLLKNPEAKVADRLTLTQEAKEAALPITKKVVKFSRDYSKYLIGAGVAIVGAAIYRKWPVSAKLVQQHGDKLVETVTDSATPIMQEATGSASSAAVPATSAISEAASSRIKDAFDAVTAHPYAQKVSGWMPSRQSVQNLPGYILEHPGKTAAIAGTATGIGYLFKTLLEIRGALTWMRFY